MFYKKGVLKIFANFAGKHLCQSLFFNKVEGPPGNYFWNCGIEQTLTDTETGGALLYISKQLNYKQRTDLQIKKSKQVKSVEIEIIDTTLKNTIVILSTSTPTAQWQYLMKIICMLYLTKFLMRIKTLSYWTTLVLIYFIMYTAWKVSCLIIS